MKRKIQIYDKKLDDYKEIEVKVIARYKYKRDGDSLSCIKDKIYDCISIVKNNSFKNGLEIIDETNEPYIYNANDFELVERYEDIE